MKSVLHKTCIPFFLTILIGMVPVQPVSGQEYTFSEIKEIFMLNPPQYGNTGLREACFGSLDDIIIGTYPPMASGIKPFYVSMVHKALMEIQTEQVTEGATVWQIYNHGFIVKTPTRTIAFDFKNYYYFKEIIDLADYLDVLFISHEHSDHYDVTLVNNMKNLGKPVVGPSEWSVPTIGMDAGESQEIAGLQVTAHYGLHNVPVRQFEVVTPEGLKFLHTGDNQTSETLPEVTGIDIMMLDAWINESGATSWIEGVRIAVNKMKPQVTLAGHIMALSHLGGIIVPYRDALASDDGTLLSEYYVMAWGERIHYGENDDTVPPNTVQNLNWKFEQDTLRFVWDSPEPAVDGDTASFYRLQINDSEDFWTMETEFVYEDKASDLQNVKVYTYDSCGNQSTGSAELQIAGSLVYTTFVVTVPQETPADETVYIAGNFNQWDPGAAETGIDNEEHDLPMVKTVDNEWEKRYLLTAGESIEYKYTRGSWNSVEKDANGGEIQNRILTVPSEDMIQADTVERWKDMQGSAVHSYEKPSSCRLYQNVPNPFNPVTRIDYTLQKNEFVIIEIYNIAGEKIATLVKDVVSAGRHSIMWNGKNQLSKPVPSGLYLCRISTPSFQKSIRMTLLK